MRFSFSRLVNEGKVDIKPVLYAFSPFAVAAFLRVYPCLISGLPFSVNSWPSIRCAELLLNHTDVHLRDVSVFGAWHDELVDKLYGALISALTWIQPIHVVSFLVPLAGTTSILIFYMLVNRLYEKSVSLIASLFASTAFSDVILTAGVKGETYAHPSTCC